MPNGVYTAHNAAEVRRTAKRLHALPEEFQAGLPVKPYDGADAELDRHDDLVKAVAQAKARYDADPTAAAHSQLVEAEARLKKVTSTSWTFPEIRTDVVREALQRVMYGGAVLPPEPVWRQRLRHELEMHKSRPHLPTPTRDSLSHTADDVALCNDWERLARSVFRWANEARGCDVNPAQSHGGGPHTLDAIEQAIEVVERGRKIAAECDDLGKRLVEAEDRARRAGLAVHPALVGGAPLPIAIHDTKRLAELKTRARVA